MAGRIETDLIVRAIAEGFDRVAAELRETGDAAQMAGEEVGRSGSGASNASTKWTELNSQLNLAKAAFHQVAGAAKDAYSFLKEGAELELAEMRFGRLAQAVGTTATALQEDIGVATRGMLTKAESIALAGDLMSLGLAKTHDQTVRLSRVASALNMDMNQLVLTLANQTTMRFDQLGVAVDGFDERLGDLKATGMDVNAAFTEAFLQQAEAQILKVGDAADTTLGKLERLENRAEDSWNRLKQQALEGALPIIDAALKIADASDVLAEAYERGIITQRELLKLQRDLGTPALRESTDATIEHIQAQLDDANAALAAAEAYERRRAAIDQTSGAVREVSQALLDYEARREGIWTDETAKLHVELEKERAEEDYNDFIKRLSGNALEIQLALREPDNRGGNIFDEIAQANWREEYKVASQALAEQFGANFNSVLEEKLTGVRPEIPPIAANAETSEVDILAEKLGLTRDEIEGINTTTIEPAVVDDDVVELHTNARLARDELVALSEAAYPIVIDTNLLSERQQLGQFAAEWNALTSKEITLTVNRVDRNPGSPFGGPYTLPNG